MQFVHNKKKIKKKMFTATRQPANKFTLGQILYSVQLTSYKKGAFHRNYFSGIPKAIFTFFILWEILS